MKNKTYSYQDCAPEIIKWKKHKALRAPGVQDCQWLTLVANLLSPLSCMANHFCFLLI